MLLLLVESLESPVWCNAMSPPLKSVISNLPTALKRLTLLAQQDHAQVHGSHSRLHTQSSERSYL